MSKTLQMDIESIQQRLVLPPVLDARCGSRMFWFDRKDPRALFVDKRRARHMTADCSVKNGEREIVVDPDSVADFTALPFAADTFAHVLFDPPPIHPRSSASWTLKKHGVIDCEWREMLRQGFAECFRVLRPFGTLIFKWNEIEAPLREILALTPERPLYGHRTGKQAKTHWVAFLKGGGGAELGGDGNAEMSEGPRSTTAVITHDERSEELGA